MSMLTNTLFVTTQGSYLHLERESVRVEHDGKTVKRVPLNHIGCITALGNVLVSPQLMQKLTETGRGLVFLTRNGRFASRVSGPVSGNVLLRRAQFQALEDEQATFQIARCFVAGKLQNSRHVLMRGARDTDDATDHAALSTAAGEIAGLAGRLEDAGSVEEVRGIEGIGAKHYFSVFNNQLKQQRSGFLYTGRSRRPPRDNINALLSFLYTLLRGDCVAALEGVGLDPQVGYLHVLRPGRPALALDLMEELRPLFADRLALSMINRRQIGPGDFDMQVAGAVWLTDEGRKKVIIQYQQRKEGEIKHPVLGQKTAWGLVPHAQARLLARHLRGETPFYPPFIWK